MLVSCIIIIWLFLKLYLRSENIVKLVLIFKHTMHAFETSPTIFLIEVKPGRISVKLIFAFHLLSFRQLTWRTLFIVLSFLTFIWFLGVGVSGRLSKLMLMFDVHMIVTFFFFDTWRVQLYHLPMLLIVVMFFLFVADRMREGKMVIVPYQSANFALFWLVEILLQFSLLHLTDTQQQILTNTMHWFLRSTFNQTHTDRRVSVWISRLTNNPAQFFASI